MRSASSLRRIDWVGVATGAACALAALIVLALASALIWRAAGVFSGGDAAFLHKLRAALLGSLWILFAAGAVAVPAAFGTAVWLVEFASQSRLTRAMESLVFALAAVPSVVLGLAGYFVFGAFATLGRTLAAGAAILFCMALPKLVLSICSALRSVPMSLRQDAYSLGATPVQALRRHVLPSALPRMLDESARALSLIAGEATALLVVGAVFTQNFPPFAAADPIHSLPTQLFHWTLEPDPKAGGLAGAGALLLLLLIGTIHGSAFAIKRWHLRRQRL